MRVAPCLPRNEGGGRAIARSEGVYYLKELTPPVTFGASPLKTRGPRDCASFDSAVNNHFTKEMPPGVPAASVILPGAAAIAVRSVTIAWGKSFSREWNPGEHLAGIFSAAGTFTAFFCGNAVFCHRHNQLGIPFQTDNRKLSQAHIQAAVFVAKNQFLVKCRANAAGNLHQTALPAVANIPNP